MLLVAVLTVLALTGCAPAADKAGTSKMPDTAACPHGAITGVADLPHIALACLTSPGTVEMSQLHGKPEIINIWASWCAPCREEIPLLERAHDLQGDRVQFVGVDVRDSGPHARSFLAARGVSYPQVFDPDGAFARALGLRGVPDTLFVDAQGHVALRVLGPVSQTRLEQGLAALGPT